MMTILSPIFQSVLKRRDTKLFMAFAFLPLATALLINSEGIDTAFKADKTVSWLTFLASDLTFQMSTTLPLLVLSFIIYSVFREEFDSGIMFLYKDIQRSLIFKAKVLSIFALYGLYLLTTTMISSLAYFLIAVPRYHFSGDLFPKGLLASQSVFLQLLAVLSLTLIAMMIIAALSLKYKVGVAAMAGIFFILWANVAPQLRTARYLFPTGYAKMLHQIPLPLALVLSLVISLTYFSLAYRATYRQFLKKEF